MFSFCLFLRFILEIRKNNPIVKNHRNILMVNYSSIYLTFTWNLGAVESLEEEQFYLPDNLEVEAMQKAPLDDQDKDLGTYTVHEDGKVELSLNKATTDKKGHFTIQAKLKEDALTDDEAKLTFTFSNKSKTIIFPLESNTDEKTTSQDNHGHESTLLKTTDHSEAKENTRSIAPMATVDDTKAITLDQSYSNQESDDSFKTTYYIDEDITYEVNLTISGNETTLTNYILKIEFPSEHSSSTWKVILPELASNVKYKNEDGNRVAYITFPTLSGGTKLSFPVEIKFKGGTHGSLVPEGYRLPVDVSLLNADKELVKSANTLYFEAIYPEIGFSKRINNKNFNGQSIFAGIVEEDIVAENGAVDIPFNFTLTNIYNNPKIRSMAEATIIDTLPPNATFEPEKNPGWELSEDGTKISKTYKGSTNSELVQAIEEDTLLLSFPGAKINETIKNEAEIHFVQKNKQEYEPDYTYSNSIDFVLDGDLTGNFFYKTANSNQKNIYNTNLGKQDLQEWSIRVANPTGVELRDIVILDDQLDERLEFHSVKPLTFNYFEDSEIEFIAIVDEEGTEVKLQEEDGKILFPEGSKALKVKIDRLAPYTSDQYFYFYTKLKNPADIDYDEEESSNNLFPNEAIIDAYGVIPDYPEYKQKLEASNSDRYTLVEVDEKVKISKSILSPKTQYLEGDNITFNLVFQPSKDVQADRVFKNAKFIDFVPEGLTPRENSNYTIIEDYKDTGRTAVIYELGDLKGNERISRSLYATVNKLSEEGVNTNEVYFVYEGEQLPIDGDNKAPDQYDLYGDGDTQKEINYATVDYNYIPVKEVVSRKYIKKDTSNIWSAKGITTKENEAFQYRLNVVNNLDVDLNKLMIYEVLPYKGDNAIVTNENNERVSRESVFSNYLTGAIKSPEGFTTYYTTDDIPEKETEAIHQLNWKTSLSDYSKTTAIKIVMDENHELKSKEQIDFILPMKAPKQWNLETGDRAYNSFAISTNEGASFVEGNKVYNKIKVSERLRKTVNHKEHLDIDREREYEYQIVADIPEDIEDYEKFTVIDEVDPNLRINTDKITVTVDGKTNDALKVDVVDNLVTVAAEDFSALKGKEQIELTIPAKIKIDANINEYEDGNIPNTAKVEFKHQSRAEDSIETEPVTVTPQDPSIVKTVNGKQHLTIDYEENYVYEIATSLPKDIQEYSKLVITDVIDKGLSIDTEAIEAKVDGEAYDGLELEVSNNTVTLSVTDFAGLQGKHQIELTIPAHIKKDTDINQYENKEIPNTALLNFTNADDEEKQKETEPVTVTPPAPPTITKDVEGKTHLDIEREEDFTYYVHTKIPEDLSAYKNVTIKDQLDNNLKVIDAKVTVDKETSDLKSIIDGQTITLNLDKEALESLAGATVTLEITTQINEDTGTVTIDNTATLQLNNHPAIESNTVTVTPIEPKIPEEPTQPETPEKPEDETPEKETKEPKETEKDKTSPINKDKEQPIKIIENPVTTDEAEPIKEENKLPKTATYTFSLITAGLALLLLGLLFARYRKRVE